MQPVIMQESEGVTWSYVVILITLRVYITMVPGQTRLQCTGKILQLVGYIDTTKDSNNKEKEW